MQDFAPIVRQIKREQAIRVRRWRKQMSGCSWQVRYADGRVERWIESPFPKTPISLAIFLHEVGHHVIGFDTYKLRCEEEYHAWKWAIDRMQSLGVEPDEKVLSRFERSMQYAVGKALRRRIRELPDVLRAFAPEHIEIRSPQNAMP
ncbi:MAG TPA: hypothetical protein VN541_09615 [Tepidisphaeraceae bacterium]|nr:hypothetical protein [Tepidisphaeraceae bacterium]